MAQISLHDYLQQIDTLLEENRLSEAIAHCRHILQKFPRHVGTYRLYGKALLEQQKFDDAVDIFKRVLSADPEDFISHVGLAITHKEKGEVPEAIWHFERAFEMDPYNAAIQDELRDLYANRDGLRPERINLTRGALARLYFRGNLYRQAAEELRHLLAQTGDPKSGERLDLQTLLAETLWRDDQRVDVVDVCLRILEKTPFSIKANAILAEVWLVTGRGDEAQENLQRLRMLTRPEKAFLDPESVIGRAFTTNGFIDLPERVLIEELDYIPVAQELSGESDWVSELTIESEEVDEEASWLDEIEKVDAEVFAEAAASDSDEDMLDWLRDVAVSDEPLTDTTEDDGDAIVLSDLEDEQPDTVLEDSQEDTFDWFSEEAETSRESLEDVPDWLSEVTASAEADMWNLAIEANEGLAETEEDDRETGEVEIEKQETPDWIRDAAEENAALDPTASWLEEGQGESLADLADDDEFPDWMSGEDGDDDFPDWLAESDETTLPDEGTVPDWLTGPEGESEEEFPDFSTEDTVFGVTGEDIPDWLFGEDEVKETDAAESPDLESDLEDTAPEADSSVTADFDAEDNDMPDWLLEDQNAADSGAVDDLGDLPDWLKADTGFLNKETDEDQDLLDEAPEWLSDIESDEQTDIAVESDLVPDQEPDDEMPDWLNDFDQAEQAETEVEVEGIADQETDEEMPDWLGGLDQVEQADTEVEAEVVAEPESGDDVPDWLNDFDQAEQTGIETDSDIVVDQESIDELPEWLSELGEAEQTEEDGTFTDLELVDELPEWLSDFEQVEQSESEMESDPGTGQEIVDQGPEWLSDIEQTEQADIVETERELAPDQGETPEWQDESEQAVDTGEELPDWLEDSPDLIVGQTDIDHENLPDWLDGEQEDMDREDMLMGDAEDKENKEPEIPEDLDEAMKWLEELAAEQGADLAELPSLQQKEEKAGETSVVENDDVPDWLKADLTDGELSGGDDLPDWLKQEAESMSGDDWLGISAEDDMTSMDYEEPESEGPIQSDDIPDWLKQQMPENLQAQESSADSGEDLGWLDQIAAGEGAPLEELPTLSWDEDQDDIPLEIEDGDLSWMDDVPEVDVSVAEEVDHSDLHDESSEDIMASVPDDPDEAMAWLEKLAADQGAPLDELPTMADDEPLETDEVSLADIFDEVDVDVDQGAPTVADEPEEVAADAVSDLGVPDDPDEAMAWLEQLAAAQGASLDELSTVTDMDVEAEAAVVPEIDTSETPTVIDIPPDEAFEEEGLDIPDDPDEAMAWLEQLAARQGADLDELPSVDVVPEMETPVAGIVADVEEVETRESEAVSEPEVDAEFEMALAELSDIDMPEDDEEALAWLAALTGEPVEAAAEEVEADSEPEPTFDTVDTFEQPAAEPEPVQTLETEQPMTSVETDVFDEAPEEISIFDPIEDETDQLLEASDDLTEDIDSEFGDDVDSALPDWLKFEPTGETSREELDWLDTFGESDVDSWLEAEEMVSQYDMPVISESPEPESIITPEPEPEPEPLFETGPLGEAAVPVIEEFEVEHMPTEPADEDQLESARSALDSGDMETAIEHYNSLLQSGRGVPMVIAHLESASTKHAKVAPLHRLLGDAYMQNGQLQKAIETYRQALDSL